MSLKSKIYIFVFLIISFLFGIVLDRFILTLPISIEKTVNIVDIASLLTTILIAILIPFFITKLIEDNRSIKSDLIGELKDIIQSTCEIKSIISNSYSNGVFKVKDRDAVNYSFHELELDVYSFQQQIKVAFSDKAKEINETLSEIFFNYKDFLTGGELMISTFKKVNENFYRENNTKFSKFETGIKTLIQKIHKY